MTGRDCWRRWAQRAHSLRFIVREVVTRNVVWKGSGRGGSEVEVEESGESLGTGFKTGADVESL